MHESVWGLVDETILRPLYKGRRSLLAGYGDGIVNQAAYVQPGERPSLLGTAVASKERLTSLSVTLIQTGCIAPWWCESLSHRGGPVRRPIGLLNHNLSAGCRPPTNAGFVPIALPETCLCFHVQSRWRLLCAATRYGKGTSMKVVVVHEVYFVRSLQSILLSGRG